MIYLCLMHILLCVYGCFLDVELPHCDMLFIAGYGVNRFIVCLGDGPVGVDLLRLKAIVEASCHHISNGVQCLHSCIDLKGFVFLLVIS
ncbi:MAG: hypothetical protein BWY40_00911 [bacterium ADurb.Bin270]|nr:MAG: hypothetical protein BWY40_00911 [bacterium ADurb.Bin270]